MDDTVYCYPNSNVLRNKLDIREQEKLSRFERKLTMLRLIELIEHPIKGAFDFEHLAAIHAYIFQDVYEWAGKIRTVDIAKGTMFCNVKFLSSQADEIFGKLRNDRYLEGLSKDDFIKKLVFYFSEINALHPFRDGNGRSQREFIRSLAIRNGYIIQFAEVSEAEMIKASRDSFLCDYYAMEVLFRKCIKEKF